MLILIVRPIASTFFNVVSATTFPHGTRRQIEIEIVIVYNIYRMRRFMTNTVYDGCCLWALPTMPYKKLTSQG
jgi:hypothetical protein